MIKPLRNVDVNSVSIQSSVSEHFGKPYDSRPATPVKQPELGNSPTHLSPSRAPNSSKPDPVACTEYVDEIIDHLSRRELTLRRDSRYMTHQSEVTERMRMILVDWMIDVAIKFKVHTETFHLAVDIVDRYMSVANVARSHLQLVGVTAMLLAAKHEEIWAPEVKDCIYISANTYTQVEVIGMERDIACELRFRFTVPTSYPFACNLLDRLGAPSVARHATMFFLEASTLEYSLLEFLPSHIAAASMMLALMTLYGYDEVSLSSWYPQYHQSCTPPMSAVVPCAEKLLLFSKSLLLPTCKFQALSRKFSSSRYSAVATMKLPTAIPECLYRF